MPLDMNGPLFDLTIIKDYTAETSMLVIRFHHIVMDGLAITTVLEAISDKYDYKNLSGLKPLPFFLNVIVTILSPIIHIWATVLFFSSPKEKNAIMKYKGQITGRKRMAMSDRVNIVKVKECAK